MPPEKKFEDMTLEEVSQHAANIRLVSDFENASSNTGFNPDLIDAQLTPKRLLSEIDYSLFPLTIFLIIFFVILCLRYYSEIPIEVENLLLVGGIFAGTCSVFCAHLKFDNITCTIVLSIGLILIIIIGFEIMTPRETIDKAGELNPF